MNIQVRFFASVREALGVSQETLVLPVDVATVGQLRAYLRRRGAAWEAALGEHKPLRTAFNQHMSSAETPLGEGCEVAFFPPVTGG